MDLNFSEPGFLGRLKSRERNTVRAVVDAYLPQLLRAARGMGFSLEAAEDLAQSTFLGLIESAPNFEGRAHIRTYLFSIFYNKVKEHLREVIKIEKNDPIDEVVESRFDQRGRWRRPPADIEREIYGMEAGKSIRDCLGKLPDTQRIVFYLREVEEMSTQEICKKMDLSSTNIGVILFRARHHLRECLERKGFRKE